MLSSCVVSAKKTLKSTKICVTTIFRVRGTPQTGLALGQTCQSGIWKDINFSLKVAGTFQVWPGQTVNLGRFKLCINTYRIDGRELAITEVIPTDGPDANGYMNWRATNATQYSPYYMGIHCFI
ncbi:hypothetical protein DSQ27_16225 [Salmonella enterica]|nr:hypothetical protein [Salmonella enterica]